MSRLTILRRHYSTVLYAAAVFFPEVSVHHPHVGLVGFSSAVLGYACRVLVPGFHVVAVESEIDLLIMAIHGRAVESSKGAFWFSALAGVAANVVRYIEHYTAGPCAAGNTTQEWAAMTKGASA